MLGTHEGIMRVQKELLAMQSKADKDAADKAAAVAPWDERKATADAERDKLENKDHTEAEYARDLQGTLAQIEVGKKRMATMDKDSVEYHKMAALLSENELEVLRDQEALKRFKDKADASKPTSHMEATHVDAMTQAGLFQSVSSVTSNPVLEVSRQQLAELRGIHRAVTQTRQDPHAA